VDAVNGWRLAVDVGTSNTAAAVQIGTGPPRPVRLSDQADQMPSGVLAGPAGLIVGVEAQRSARIDPAAFEPTPKRRVGEGEILLGGHEVAVADALAAVLRQVAGRAGRIAGGGPPAEVLLTYPEQWQEPRRQVLLAAARAAGLAEAPRLVSEPVAAASHYATRQTVPPGAVVAVFDFGGGTCDVAVLRAGAAAGAPFTVLATDGIDPLGGEDIDDLLARWTRQQLREAGHGELADALDDPAALADRLTFRDQVRAAKQALTDYEQTGIPVAAGGRQAVVTITAEEFDRLIAPSIDRAVELTRRTLERAGVAGHSLHALYLTGGSSHLRLVQRRLLDLIGRPPATLEDPKLVVALGALAAPVPAPPVPPPPVPPVPPPVPPDQGRPETSRARAYRWPLAVGAGLACLLLVCGGIAAALLIPDGDDGTGSKAGNGASTGPNRRSPSTETSASAPARTGTCAAGLTTAQCALAQRLPPDFAAIGTCAGEDDQDAGEVAVVRCETPPAARVGTNPGVEVWATQFASAGAMRNALDVTVREQNLTNVTVGCDAGKSYGRGPWVLTADQTQRQGELFCYPAGQYGKLIWTYERHSILMVATAYGTDIPALVRWWSSPDRSAAIN
jgi:hypothetical protein